MKSAIYGVCSSYGGVGSVVYLEAGAADPAIGAGVASREFYFD